MASYLIKDLENNEKPREKMAAHGPSTLSDSELLAIVLRSGGKDGSAIDLARKILKEFGGLKGLANSEIEQLTKIKDVGIAKATSVKAACEIALRIDNKMEIENSEIKKPEDVFSTVKKDTFARNKEQLFLLSLNSRNRLISKDLISIGTLNETLIHPREVFKTALSKNAASIILVHNHPSNDSGPSTDDIKVTERIAKAGITIGIPLIDHVIVCDNGYTSLKSLNLFSTYKANQKGGE